MERCHYCGAEISMDPTKPNKTPTMPVTKPLAGGEMLVVGIAHQSCHQRGFSQSAGDSVEVPTE